MIPVVKVRGNAGQRRSWALKIAVERSQIPHNVKGTLRRRLSHGYFSFIAKYTSTD